MYSELHSYGTLRLYRLYDFTAISRLYDFTAISFDTVYPRCYNQALEIPKFTE